MRTASLFFLAAAVAAAGDFQPLFDGKTLKGWEQCNGTAKYWVEKGAIAGRTVEGSPNSFLCTTKAYGDFILEFDVKVDPVLNSGVQIRSHRYAEAATVKTFDGKKIVDRKHEAGRVHGYQVEISNEESGASGGIYDEARRGWLHNIASDPAASKAFKDNEWNRYRVVAYRDTVKTWINGVPCADVVDPVDQSGFIALQVHQFKGEKPAEVRWRNIRIHDMGRHEWKPLFDGKTLDGWAKRGGGTFTVEDGAIHGKTVPGDERAGYVVSERSFKNVTARVRFKIPSGNSGFFVRAAQKNLAGYEVEVDAEKRTGGFWEVGGRNWVTGPEDNAGVIPGEWNDLTASLHGHRIVFHLNGIPTVNLPNDAQGVLEGHIALQAHGAKRPTDVWFKEVAVLEPVK
ncbi:MAG TPA: DUF1080 domain-containing protein [Bryobacteraceae bacterium]|nr:DUF1080 domain-containing protein [Bryobacteraceae bacterium]